MLTSTVCHGRWDESAALALLVGAFGRDIKNAILVKM
jgi:hypothetical protein